MHAFKGIKYVFLNERNFQIETTVGLLALFAMYFFETEYFEKIIVVLMVLWVLVLELINTAVERLVDMLKPRIHPYARVIKDMMASAVLISATVSALIGLTIFVPYVLDSL